MSFKLRLLHKGLIQAITFDTSIGNGVDGAGFASLPLRSGAKRVYVNASTGSDANTLTQAQSASTPVATIAKAQSYIAGGSGDQILVAQGTTYATAMPDFQGYGGYSAVYPTVIQSYDPADPTNEAKLGRATGSNRPTFTASQQQGTGNGFISNHTSTNYLALRGLDFNPGNISNSSLTILQNAGQAPHSYLLFENCKFQYMMLATNQSAASSLASKFIVRNCAFHGQWENSIGDQQGIYAEGTDGLIVEDSVFWHCGWKEGAARSDAPSAGGATQFSHPIYNHGESRRAVVRRNAFIDCASDGSTLKGGGLYSQNLVLRCPIGVMMGKEDSYGTLAPSGVDHEVAYNAIIGGGGPLDSGATDWGVYSVNGTPTSSTHHNVIARSSTYGANATFYVDAFFNQPSYMNNHDNVAYLWSLSGSATRIADADKPGERFPAQCFPTYSNNKWDDPTSGTNTNVGGVTFANAYTEASLLSALGYADETSAINDWIANPEQHGWRNSIKLALSGYGVDISAMPYIG